jgi:hypothetical protein
MVGAGYDHWLDAFDQIGAMLYEPLAAALEIRVTVERVSRHRGSPKDGNEADHGVGAH